MTQTAYYAKQLERGLVYQDFVAEILWGVGIGTCSYSSRLFQQRIGENKAKIEIKFDDKLATTGNLWIEVAEKSRPDRPSYVTSGIYRDCVEYVIGNFDVIYRFPTNVLRAIHDRGEHAQRENGMKTSKGFLLPQKRAERIAMQVLEPRMDGDVRKIIERQGRLDRDAALALAKQMRRDERQSDLFQGGDPPF